MDSLFRAFLLGFAKGYVWGMRVALPVALVVGIVWMALGHWYFGVIWNVMCAFGLFAAWKTPVRNLR